VNETKTHPQSNERSRQRLEFTKSTVRPECNFLSIKEVIFFGLPRRREIKTYSQIYFTKYGQEA
jgi:hypothetical protein